MISTQTHQMINNENQSHNVNNNNNNFLNFEVLPLSLRKKVGIENLTHDHIIESAKQEFDNVICKEHFIPNDPNIRKEIYPTSYCPENINKNRYNNAPATENTRIILNDRDEDEDYINANRIVIPNCQNDFIICQAPVQSTFDDFYQMIWQEGAQVIVCLSSSQNKDNNLSNGDDQCISNNMMEENEKIKTNYNKGNSQYWPQYPIKVITTNDFSITLINESSNDSNFHVRVMNLYKVSENQSRKIVHIQYSDWNDGGVCRNNIDFLNLVKLTHSCQSRNTTPIVVHCSAGLGRSGLFVCVFSSIQILNKGVVAPVNLNVSQILSLIRSQRNGCVQNNFQYAYIYLILNLYVLNMRHASRKISQVK
eukprot:TRINITY_DN3540_c0_g1_i1.p1 TRINITY_DN3540_c0_g1~~TRINITY_DN3540_c0_g1_i1.p1  ORF type:complete len:366 (-),score=87.19 TRINITY_DN3540_c0_g1_i1:24-1121(-)